MAIEKYNISLNYEHDENGYWVRYDDHSSEIERRVEPLEIIKEKASALLARLDEISCHPSYLSQVDIAYIHGHRYTGPDFKGVADELREALRAADNG